MQLNLLAQKDLSIMSLLSSPSTVPVTRTAISSTITPMVKIISQETIKPSTPTPYHLRTHKLSLLDHLPPPMYICFTLFYDQTNWRRNLGDDLHRHLKKTLAETLTDFYMLAGKVKHSHEDEGFKFIDCTDDGVEYLEARVNAQLHETINKDPDMYLLNQFLPLNPCQLVVRNTGSGSSSGSSPQPILAVQVNTFDCGGLAVGVSMSHEVADTSGLVLFIQAWAAKAHGGSDTKPVDPPLIGFESLFPLRALPEGSIALFRDDIATKRFVFHSSKISSLREKMMISMNDGSYLTRVEVLTTFMWRRFMNIHQAKIRSGQTDRSLQLCVGQAVNVRKRINLSPNSFGNLYFSSLLPMFSIDGSDKDYTSFMSRLRDTVHNVNEDYVGRELQSGEDGEYLKFDAKVGEGLCGGELETLNFTSWCRMGYYEVDFGWGKPVWMCPGTIPFKDVVLFTNSKSGNGIEVWVYMIQEDINALELDQEFLAYFS